MQTNNNNMLDNSSSKVCNFKLIQESSPFLSIASRSLVSMGGAVSGRENCSVKSGRQKPKGDFKEEKKEMVHAECK